MNKLKQRREELKLTQKQVSKVVGITQQSFQRYENGTVIPNVNIALRIAQTLKTTVEDLFLFNVE